MLLQARSQQGSRHAGATHLYRHLWRLEHCSLGSGERPEDRAFFTQDSNQILRQGARDVIVGQFAGLAVYHQLVFDLPTTCHSDARALTRTLLSHLAEQWESD